LRTISGSTGGVSAKDAAPVVKAATSVNAGTSHMTGNFVLRAQWKRSRCKRKSGKRKDEKLYRNKIEAQAEESRAEGRKMTGGELVSRSTNIVAVAADSERGVLANLPNDVCRALSKINLVIYPQGSHLAFPSIR
jgi:hypothetical protein